MPPTPEKMSQAAFARYVGRTPGRISQLKSSGALTADCFDKDDKGRDVVIVARAIKALRMNLDPAQHISNGKPLPDVDDDPADAGDLPFGDPSDILPRQALQPRASSAADDYNRERVRKLRIENEVAEERRRADAGTYIRAQDVSGVFLRTLEQIVSAIDTDLLGLAEDLAGQHGTEITVELIGLRKWFARVRERIAREQAAMLERLPQFEEDAIEDTAADGNPVATCAAPGGGSGVEGAEAAPSA